VNLSQWHTSSVCPSAVLRIADFFRRVADLPTDSQRAEPPEEPVQVRTDRAHAPTVARHIADTMPAAWRALAPFVLFAGITTVRGDVCYEPGNDNYYPLYGGRVTGACVPLPNLVCTDPEAANYAPMSKCQSRACIWGRVASRAKGPAEMVPFHLPDPNACPQIMRRAPPRRAPLRVPPMPCTCDSWVQPRPSAAHGNDPPTAQHRLAQRPPRLNPTQ
jgi:hypothetical protein